MNKLNFNNKLPINLWLSIAECVQKFNVSNGSEKEKEKNSISLIKFLKQKGYNLEKEEALKLINAIYNINCDIK